MGCCSSQAIAPKDPEDKTLDEVDMIWTWVQDFDDVFNSVAEPMNTAVTLNNAIVTSFDKVKEAAAAIFGAHEVRVTFQDNKAVVAIYSVDDDGNEVTFDDAKLEELFGGANGADLRNVWTSVQQVKDSLNTAIENAPQVVVSVKKARLFYSVGTSTKDDESNISTAKGQIASFNNTIFKLKLEIMRASAEQALNPKNAVTEIFSNLKKHAANLVPQVDIDFSGLADGHGRFNVRMPDFDTKILPRKIRTAYLALFSTDSDDTGLIPTIQDCVEQLSGLMEQINGIQQMIEGLPKDPSELMAAAQRADLGPYWTPKVPGRVATNSQQAARAPSIVQQLIATIKWAAEEIQGAISELP